MLKNQSHTKTTQKNDSLLKITTWLLAILILIYGILLPLTNSIIDKSISDLLSTILFIIIFYLQYFM